MNSYPTFKTGERAYASRIGMGAGACWTFDEPVRVVRRAATSPYRDQPAYIVRSEDGNRSMYAAENLNDVPVSYPRLTWLDILEARGLPRPEGF